MLVSVRHRVVAVGVRAWLCAVRARGWLRAIGRPGLQGLDHVTLPVADLDAARRFYCDVLGAEHLMTVDAAALASRGLPAARADGQGTYHVSVIVGGATRLDLFLQSAGPGPDPSGHPHYAFSVPARQMKRWQRRLKDHGIPTDGPLQLGPPGQASLYFNDPFGNHLELVCLGYAERIEQRGPVIERLVWNASSGP
ncbi:MAG: VOC family protein [Myxococcales bacterium FL481]|nr:MAG: VOC family protein [Myxococcales bacterium FL481]